MTLWLSRWAVLNRSWGNDEELYRHFAGGMSRDFGLFLHIDPSYGRGVQRLHLLLMAIPMALFESPTAFKVAHVLFVATYTSAAIPAWLIARGAGLRPLPALVPAVLVVLTPWSVVTTSFLAEPVGYGVFAWALWAIWRAAARPSLLADVLALALLGLAVLARTGFLVLLPVLPMVAVLQAWRYGTAGNVAVRLRQLPRAALARQPVAVGLGLVAVVVVLLAWAGVLPGGVNRFTGSYATSLPPLTVMAAKWRTFLSRVDAGTGFLMFAVAVPWLAVRIARPREPALHALAWTALLASLSVLLALVGGPGDERYVMYLGFTVPLVASIALLRRQLNPLMAVLGGACALALLLTPGWRLAEINDYGYFSFPIESFMHRVVLEKLPGAPLTIAGILLAGALLTLVLLTAHPRLRRALPLALVAAAAFQFTETGYALNKFVNTAGEHHGPSLAARAWVDTNVPDGENVGLLAVSSGLTGNYNFVWREIQFWNLRTRAVVKIVSPITLSPSAEVPYPFGTRDIQASLDLTTGRLHANGPWRFPRYLVIPQAPLSVVLDWAPVAAATYVPATLVRVRTATQARATLSGASPDGHLAAGTPAVITVYRDGRPATRCLSIDLVPRASKPGLDVGQRFRVRDGRRTIAHGPIPLGTGRRVYVPVRFDGPATAFTIEGFGPVDPGLGSLSAAIADYRMLPTACPPS